MSYSYILINYFIIVFANKTDEDLYDEEDESSYPNEKGPMKGLNWATFFEYWSPVTKSYIREWICGSFGLKKEEKQMDYSERKDGFKLEKEKIINKLDVVLLLQDGDDAAKASHEIINEYGKWSLDDKIKINKNQVFYPAIPDEVNFTYTPPTNGVEFYSVVNQFMDHLYTRAYLPALPIDTEKIAAYVTKQNNLKHGRDKDENDGKPAAKKNKTH